MGRKAPFQGKDGKLLIGLQLAGLLNLLHYFPLLYELWLLWRYKYANTDIYVHMLQNKDAFIRPMYHWMEVTLNNTYVGNDPEISGRLYPDWCIKRHIHINTCERKQEKKQLHKLADNSKNTCVCLFFVLICVLVTDPLSIRKLIWGQRAKRCNYLNRCMKPYKY